MSIVHNMVGGASGGGIDWDSAILHIYAPAGSAVTVSKGGTSHSLTEHPVSGADSEYLYYVKLAEYGTWTVTASLSGQTATQTVVVEDNIEYSVQLAYFTATLRVYANNGSTVTAVNGTHTVSGTVSGTYVDLTIKFSGTWTVTANDGTYSGTDAVSITEETSYELDMDFKQNYQEVEYLESPMDSNLQYIDTGVAVNSNSRIELGIQFGNTQTKRGGSGYSARTGRQESGSNRVIILSEGVRLNFQVGSTGNNYIDASGLDYHDVVLDIKNSKVIVDGTEHSITKGTTFPASSFLLYTSSSEMNHYSSIKFKYARMYNNNTVQRLCKACYKKSNNVAGMYDKVSKTLFTNAGTGTLIVGGDVA